jgi:hypothetical protein
LQDIGVPQPRYCRFGAAHPAIGQACPPRCTGPGGPPAPGHRGCRRDGQSGRGCVAGVGTGSWVKDVSQSCPADASSRANGQTFGGLSPARPVCVGKVEAVACWASTRAKRALQTRSRTTSRPREPCIRFDLTSSSTLTLAGNASARPRRAARRYPRS